MLHFLLKSRQIVITLPFKVFFCALFFVQYSLLYRKSTFFIKKNYLNNVYLQKEQTYTNHNNKCITNLGIWRKSLTMISHHECKTILYQNL